ncbi:MAG: endonuclease III [Bdellovibrionota bacterium]
MARATKYIRKHAELSKSAKKSHSKISRANKLSREKQTTAYAKSKAGGRRTRAAKKAEPLEARRQRALKIAAILTKQYPDAECALDFKTPYELSVATILSAQCTDKRVNMVTPEFFRRWPDAASLSRANQGEVEKVIHSTGFYKNKAKNLLGFAKKITEEHGGKVPGTMEELIHLPGFGRKTANVILGNAFGVPGLTVDTHMSRLSNRMGLTKEHDPVKIDRDLMALLPDSEWTMFSHRMIHHGRAVCDARKPKCPDCAVEKICPKVGLN